MEKISDKHFSLLAANEVRNACSPLIKNFDCNFFIYQKNFIDEYDAIVKNTAFLCSDAEALRFILELRSTKNMETVKYDYNSKTRQYVFLGASQPNFAKVLQDKFNFNHIICRDERIGEKVWEHLIIGSKSRDPNVINTYVNNIDFLDKFTFYFRDSAHKLIDKSCENKFDSNRAIEKRSFNKMNEDDFYSLENNDSRHFYLVNLSGSKCTKITFSET